MSTQKAVWRFWMMSAVVGLGLVSSTSIASAEGEPLRGAALKSFISGKRIYLAAPLGGELPLYYRSSGVVDGSGQAVGLGKYMSPKDKGRWWVSGDRVCQKWQEWYDGRTFCFTLAKLPGNKVFWKRDDGKQGVARIGR